MTSKGSVLARTPARVRVGVCEALIPWHPAGAWLAEADRLPVLVSRLAELHIRDLFADEVMTRPGAAAALEAESYRILAEATGRTWWEAGRLMKMSLESEVLGRLVLAGVDPWQRSIGEWCAAAYALLVKGHDQKGRTKLDFSLSLPPKGWEDAWDDGGDDPAAIEASIASLFG